MHTCAYVPPQDGWWRTVAGRDRTSLPPANSSGASAWGPGSLAEGPARGAKLVGQLLVSEKNPVENHDRHPGEREGKRLTMIAIAVANQKGGTAKTTTAVTLAHGLALDGLRVLLVDTDVQGHVAVMLGMKKGSGIARLVERAQWGNTALLIQQARPNLDIIPSDKSTEAAKRTLVNMHYRESILERALDPLKNDYDVIVMDCAPSTDVLHEAALLAADWLVVPCKLDFLSVDGVTELLTSVLALKRQSPKAPHLFGILPTFFDRRTRETVTQLKALVAAFGPLVLPPIPVDTKLRECSAHGQTIWEYSATSRSAEGISVGNGKSVGGYRKFVQQVEDRLLRQKREQRTADDGGRSTPQYDVMAVEPSMCG